LDLKLGLEVFPYAHSSQLSLFRGERGDRRIWLRVAIGRAERSLARVLSLGKKVRRRLELFLERSGCWEVDGGWRGFGGRKLEKNSEDRSY